MDDGTAPVHSGGESWSITRGNGLVGEMTAKRLLVTFRWQNRQSQESLGPSLIHWLIVIMTRRKVEHGELHSKFLEPDIRLRDS